MKIKVQNLTGTALDWAVAKCEGVEVQYDRMNKWFETQDPNYAEPNDPHVFAPTTYWEQGGPIIEREKMGVWWATHTVDAEGTEYGNHWYAEPGMTDENADKSYICMTGPTPLIAAMRGYVASKLGDEVDVPNLLV
jgi:hypothetical protein